MVLVSLASAKKPKLGQNCSSTCETKDHTSFGACLRGKRLSLSPHVNDTYSTRQRAWDGELDRYAWARSQGVEPEGTTREKVDAAIAKAEVNG